MFIQTEQTPNPQTLKFLPGKVVMDDGTAFFQNIGEAADSPFAKRLFDVDGVEGVFFGSDFITITKNQSLDWQVMKPLILGSIMDHYNSGDTTINISKKGEDNSLICFTISVSFSSISKDLSSPFLLILIVVSPEL